MQCEGVGCIYCVGVGRVGVRVCVWVVQVWV